MKEPIEQERREEDPSGQAGAMEQEIKREEASGQTDAMDRERKNEEASGQKPAGKPGRRALYTAAALIAAAAVILFLVPGFWIRLPWMADQVFWSRGRVLRDSWVQSGEDFFYTDENGRMLFGLKKIDGKSYYFSESDGTMQTGWQTLRQGQDPAGAEQRMYFRPDTGDAATGWETIDGAEYYFDGEGVLQTGLTVIDGREYLLDSQGRKLTGWQRQDGKEVYLGEDGSRQTGWTKIEEKQYYLGEDGQALTGRQKIEGDTYFFDKKGVLQTGWVDYKGSRYYCGKDGKMRRGRVKVDGQEICLSDKGKVEPGWHTEDEETFYVFRDGAILDPDGKTGSYGRLVVPAAGLDVPLYTADSRDSYQDVVDARDSALVVQERDDVEPVIADRRSQGFDLSGIEEGSSAAVVYPDGSVQEYECVETTTGINLGMDVVDLRNDSLWSQNEGGICAYASAGEEAKEKVIVVFWEPLAEKEGSGI